MRKTGKKPTLAEKKIIIAAHLNLDNWLVQRKDNNNIYVVNQFTGNVRKLPKSLLDRR